jgi:hypothetical protein
MPEMTYKEALEIVISLAERFRDTNEYTNITGTKDREALEKVEILKNNIKHILP